MLPHIPHLFDFIHIRSLRDLPHLIIVVLLILGIVLGVYLSLQAQIFNKKALEQQGIVLQFIPEKLKIENGKTYEAKIFINPAGARVTAIELNISYDPQAVSILESKNAGFLPVELKVSDNHEGVLTLVYSSTIENTADKPGEVVSVKFKVLSAFTSALRINPDSEVTVSSMEGSILNSFPVLHLEPLEEELEKKDVSYPNNLLLEKAVFQDPAIIIRDFKELIEPKPAIKPERVKPEFSFTFLKQIGTDIFISPIAALNQVLEKKAEGIIRE